MVLQKTTNWKLSSAKVGCDWRATRCVGNYVGVGGKNRCKALFDVAYLLCLYHRVMPLTHA